MLIGIDIGGTNLKSALVDESGNIISSSSIKTNNQNTNELLQSIIKIIQELADNHDDISCIGIGVPGVVNNDGIIVVSPNLPNLNGINLRNEIGKTTYLPVFVDNDANTAAIAELIAGNGKEFNDFIYVTLGTGIGGAIIFDRQILKGSIGGAGEIGHTIISEKTNDDLPSFRQGTLEELAGKNQIIQRMQSMIIESAEEYNSEMDVKEISDLADSGNEIAIKCMSETGYYIGLGIASAMNLLDIPNVVIGGGISESGECLFSSIEKTLKGRTLPSISKRVIIKKATFRKDTGLIGAALYGFQMFKKGLNV